MNNRLRFRLAALLVVAVLLLPVWSHADEDMDVERWLSEFDMEMYAGAFESNALKSRDMLVTLTEDDLASIGVKALGHRKEIMAAIERLRAGPWIPEWSTPHWLKEIGMGEYAPIFAMNAITTREMVMAISEEDLEGIGVVALGHRKKMMAAIEELKAPREQPEAEPSAEVAEPPVPAPEAPATQGPDERPSSPTNDTVVEVHQSHMGTNLWYHVGVVDPDALAIDWGDSHKYDIGQSPMCDFDGNTVVEVHQSHTGTDLWYQVGVVNERSMTIEWGPAQKYDRGRTPIVAVNGDVVIELHQSHTGTNLWYHVGTLNRSARSISWGPSHKFDKGQIPSIGLAEVEQDVIVEVHQSHTGTNLWYHVGIVDPAARTINWGESQRYDMGRLPMCDFDGNHVVEVHQGHDDLDLWCRVGTVNERGQTIDWGPSVRYDRGKIPTVALNGNVVIEMHQSHEGTYLWYHVGILDPASRSISWGPSHKYDRGRIPSIGF